MSDLSSFGVRQTRRGLLHEFRHQSSPLSSCPSTIYAPVHRRRSPARSSLSNLLESLNLSGEGRSRAASNAPCGLTACQDGLRRARISSCEAGLGRIWKLSFASNSASLNVPQSRQRNVQSKSSRFARQYKRASPAHLEGNGHCRAPPNLPRIFSARLKLRRSQRKLCREALTRTSARSGLSRPDAAQCSRTNCGRGMA